MEPPRRLQPQQQAAGLPPLVVCNPGSAPAQRPSYGSPVSSAPGGGARQRLAAGRGVPVSPVAPRQGRELGNGAPGSGCASTVQPVFPLFLTAWGSATYIWHIAAYVSDRGQLYSLMLGYMALLVMTMWSWHAVVCTDPGGVPESCARAKLQPPNILQTRGGVRKKWCHVCRIYRPPRAHHCMYCGRCVIKHDQHNTWIRNCIGYYNHKHYMLLMSYSTLLVMYILVTGWNSFTRAVMTITGKHIDISRTGRYTVVNGYNYIVMYFISIVLGFMLTWVTGVAQWNATQNKLHSGRDTRHFDCGIWHNLVTVYGENWLMWPFPVPAHPVNDVNGLTFKFRDPTAEQSRPASACEFDCCRRLCDCIRRSFSSQDNAPPPQSRPRPAAQGYPASAFARPAACRLADGRERKKVRFSAHIIFQDDHAPDAGGATRDAVLIYTASMQTPPAGHVAPPLPVTPQMHTYGSFDVATEPTPASSAPPAPLHDPAGAGQQVIAVPVEVVVEQDLTPPGVCDLQSASAGGAPAAEAVLSPGSPEDAAAAQPLLGQPAPDWGLPPGPAATAGSTPPPRSSTCSGTA
eukprot:TRINITY_DN336_c0_g1_i2.p1 TRINITY_DN336_c0_g1~~TRINITY_DN336_c0_g1_i2.p1  ORF type:complete len:575 (+),score=122.16 TRINITY_DN336_c0_g1_i2:70-1794(+)